MFEQSKEESRRDFLKTLGLGAASLAWMANAHGQVLQPASAAAAASAPALASIPTRPFGKCGLQVPMVCFGAMGINSTNGMILREALERGFTMIDTAAGYTRGQSESMIGEVLKSFGRDKVILHTKASGFGHGLNTMTEDQAYQGLSKVLEQSLTRLGTDHIDTYVLLHGTSDPAAVTAPVLKAAVERLKKEGKIRFCGISTHQNYAATCMAAINSGWHDFVMTALNITSLQPELLSGAGASDEAPADEGAQPARRKGGMGGGAVEDMREVLQAAQAKGVGVMGMKVYNRVPGNAKPAVMQKYLPKGANYSEASVCYKAVIDHPLVSTVTVGIQNMTHLQDALSLPTMKLA